MELVLNNITYHNCPVEAREKLSLSAEQQRFMLEKLAESKQVSEAAVLQTCNRTEFYTYGRDGFDTAELLKKILVEVSPATNELWHRYSSQCTGTDAVRHLFEVAAGLDSQILGENQILAQLKSAYCLCIDCGVSGSVFHRLFHNAFRVGKAVRTETNINCGAVSVALAAVESAGREIKLSDAAAMVIGAGENAELIARYLLKAGLANLIVANRDRAKAGAVCARLKGAEAIGLDRIVARLAEVSLLISSTASEEPVITYEKVKKFLSQRKDKLLIIDVAVPRDIDPDVGRFDCVSLVNIDQLNEQIESSKESRSREIPKAKAIVNDFADKFVKWHNCLDIVPVISQLSRNGIDLARSQAERYAKDFGPDQTDKLGIFAESLVKKLLHQPISFLKSQEKQPCSQQRQAVDLINKMFPSENKRT